MDLDGLVTEAGKMYVEFELYLHLMRTKYDSWVIPFRFFHSIYQVHDELKDKLFKMEMSWVCEESGFAHQVIPEQWYQKAQQAGIDSKRDDDSDNEI